jgi:hypothetical protein
MIPTFPFISSILNDQYFFQVGINRNEESKNSNSNRKFEKIKMEKGSLFRHCGLIHNAFIFLEFKRML